MRSRRETTGQGLTPETLDYLVWSEGRIPLQIKPQKTDKITNVAHRIAGRMLAKVKVGFDMNVPP